MTAVSTHGHGRLTRADLVARVSAAQARLGRRRALGSSLSQVLDDDAAPDAAARDASRRGDHDLNDAAMRPTPPLVPAAVLVPLVEHDDDYTVLLTQRAEDLTHHPGQISFPGGRIESHDETPARAALREAEEEIGLTADFVDIIGNLDIYEVRTGFEVFPVVGLVQTGFDLSLDRSEVADVFEVPLSFVLDPRNHERQSRTYQGRLRHFYVLPFEDRFIWGATAGMLINLYEVLTGEKAAWR